MEETNAEPSRKRWRLLLWCSVAVVVCSSALLMNPSVLKMTDYYKEEGEIQKQTTTTTTTTTTQLEHIEQSTLPDWLKEYLIWHSEQLHLIRNNGDDTAWNNQSVLILRCEEKDQCGGTADRFRGIPSMLALAAETKRMFFMHWGRPYALEEFFIPGKLINWTLPNFLIKKLTVHARAPSDNPFEKIQRIACDKNRLQVQVAPQHDTFTKFQEIVKQIQGNGTNNNKIEMPVAFWHELFFGMFQPSQPVQAMFDRHMRILNLTANQYASAHYRATYPGEPYRESTYNATILGNTTILRNDTILQITIRNAIECASSKAPGLPVYVASDTVRALEMVQEMNKNLSSDHSHWVSAMDVTGQDIKNVHLNFAETSQPSSMYPIIVDWLIMAHSKCVSYGAGGFGYMASLFTDGHCSVVHSKRGKLQSCAH